MKRFPELLEDERGRLSTARLLLWLWSVVALALVIVRHQDLPPAVLGFLSGVEIALISWAGGARIAQYLAPQVGSMAQAVSQATREAIQKRRRPEEGYEESK